MGHMAISILVSSSYNPTQMIIKRGRERVCVREFLERMGLEVERVFKENG